MFVLTSLKIKVLQIVLIVLAGMSGMVSGVLLGKIYAHFQKNCIFYANVSVVIEWNRATHRSDSVSVKSDSVWGTQETCKLVNFEGILVFMICFIWLWFYVHTQNIVARLDSSDDDLTQTAGSVSRARGTIDESRKHVIVHGCEIDSRFCDSQNGELVLPPMIINTVLFITSIIRVSYARDGYQQFCDNICHTSNSLRCHSVTDGCHELQNTKWIFLAHQGASMPSFAFHDVMRAAIIVSWMEAMALGLHVVSILVNVFLLAYPQKAPEEFSSSDMHTARTWQDAQSDDSLKEMWSLNGRSVEVGNNVSTMSEPVFRAETSSNDVLTCSINDPVNQHKPPMQWLDLSTPCKRMLSDLYGYPDPTTTCPEALTSECHLDSWQYSAVSGGDTGAPCVSRKRMASCGGATRDKEGNCSNMPRLSLVPT